MISGTISESGVPMVQLDAAGTHWKAIIDTGFNGDLELPERLRPSLELESVGQIISVLAAGQEIIEEAFRTEFHFDGQVHRVEVTFVDGNEILIGTRLLRSHRLEVDFPARTVHLQRA